LLIERASVIVSLPNTIFIVVTVVRCSRCCGTPRGGHHHVRSPTLWTTIIARARELGSRYRRPLSLSDAVAATGCGTEPSEMKNAVILKKIIMNYHGSILNTKNPLKTITMTIRENENNSLFESMIGPVSLYGVYMKCSSQKYKNNFDCAVKRYLLRCHLKNKKFMNFQK